MKSTLLSLFTLSIFSLNAQSSHFPGNLDAGKFYFQPNAQILACQIDGDNASGYNKFGYQLAINTGMKLENNKSVEFMIGISERGSRRAFNPDVPSENAFHIHYNALDLGLFYGKVYNKFHVNIGLHGQYLLSVNESEGYSQNLELDYKTYGLLLDANVKYPLNDQFAVMASFNYSILSLLKSSVSNPTFYQGAGVYHNVLGFGIVWMP